MKKGRLITCIVLASTLFILAVPASALGGTLTVKSTPSGADLYIDDMLKGITPATLNGVSPGVHEIRLSSMGYEDYITSVTISLIKNTEIAAVLVPMTPTSVPVTQAGGAIIIVNPPPITLKVTTTPTISSPKRTISIKQSGMPTLSQRTTIARTSFSKTTLKPQTSRLSQFGSLEVDSFPQGADVYLDGVLKGTTPMTLPEVSSGTHQLSLGMDGFDNYSTNVQVQSGSKTSFTQGKSINLQPKGGTTKKR